MPDNVGQAVFNTAFRAAVRLLESAFLPPRLLGAPTEHAPPGADPVIILHGITDSARGSRDVANSLRRDGFTVFTPTMPEGGMDGLAANVAYLRRYVAWVLQQTGARRVDIVAHSQGGLTALAFIRAGGASAVDSVVSMASPFHGVAGYWRPIIDAVNGVGFLRWLAPRGLLELDSRSSSVHALTDGDETPGDVRYTSIYSLDADGIVLPAISPQLDGARNIVIDGPGWGFARRHRGRDHLRINHASDAYELVRHALIQ